MVINLETIHVYSLKYILDDVKERDDRIYRGLDVRESVHCHLWEVPPTYLKGTTD